MELWGIAIAAAIASVAWLYQRAWERQERRVLRYQEVLDRLPFFTEGGLNPEKQNEAVAELHRLWLSAPDDVVRAGEHFLDAVEGKIPDAEKALGEYVLAMRRDASLRSSIIPRFWQTDISSEQFRLRSAKR